MAHYRTGTININNGSTTVTGIGTDWINNAAAGECLLAPDGKLYEIASIQSSTSMTLAVGYQGASVGGAGQAYSIIPTQSFIRDLASQAAALVNGFGSLQSNAGAGKFGDGTVSQPGVRFVADEDTGVRRVGPNTIAVTAGGVDGVYVGQSYVSTPHPFVSGVAQSIADWNTLTSTGWYMGNTAANSPLVGWFIGYSVTHTPDWITQEAWSFSDNDEATNSKRYRREKNNGVWSGWVQIFSTDAEIKSIFNVPHVFSGGQKRFQHSPTDATWSNAQIEAYSSAGSLVDFSRVAFHVQDASIAPQFGYHAGLGRAGWFATDGTPRLTWNVEGGDFEAPGRVTATDFRSSSTYPNFTFAHTTGVADQKYARFAYTNGQLVFERINDAFNSVLNTPLVVSAGGDVCVGSAPVTGTTAKLQVGGDIAFKNTTSALTANVYYADTWRYFSNGPGAAIKLARDANDAFSIDVFGVNASGAGAVATITTLMVCNTSGRTSFTNSSGVGYGAGSGGTVTQASSKSTTVTLNKPCGVIFTHAEAMGAGAQIGFQVNNSTVTEADHIVHTFMGTLSAVNGNYSVRIAASNGAFFVHLTNHSGGTLAESVPISFAIIKGSTT